MSGAAGETAGAGQMNGGAPSGGTGGTAQPPNVIVIVADDLGFSDLGSFGGEIKTPHIDGLASSGVRFTNFYNSSRCSPTRASLLTGQYPHRVGISGQKGPDLSRSGVTIAEALGAAGYSTGMVGKWHLSRNPELATEADQLSWLNHQGSPGMPFSPDVQAYPAGRGFQRHYGPIWGVVDYFDPFSLVDGFDPVPSVPVNYYMTQAITDKTVEYIQDFAALDKPFFLYVAYTAPHWPLHALPEDIAKYEGAYDQGWNAIRNARYQKQLDLGLFTAESAPLPATQGSDWQALTPTQRTFLSNTMQTHAAMVDRMDQGVGAIVASLKAAGRFDNTLIMVLSDNGASSEIYLSPGFDRPSETRSGDPIVYCGGQAPCPYVQPGAQTTWTYLGPSWANALNTPFRYWKGESFRGGNNTPFIVHWPGQLGVAAGSINQEPAHVIDVLPTLLELASVEYPTVFQGNAITPLDGKSLAPTLRGEARQPHEALFFEHEGGRACIADGFKAVGLRGSQDWQLYDLASDRTETENVAAAQPARVASLQAAWEDWYADVQP